MKTQTVMRMRYKEMQKFETEPKTRHTSVKTASRRRHEKPCPRCLGTRHVTPDSITGNEYTIKHIAKVIILITKYVHNKYIFGRILHTIYP